ncbi:MAG: glycosyltransferase family 4 protein, partial [Anaerolineae bacterium]|nr:glycosyltransferase family 4 protein [Anaerolineae bacterium]
TLFLRGLALPRPEVVLVESQPVFTGLAALVLSRLKRVPYVQNVSDLWPEYLVAVGAMQPTHPIYRIFKALINLAQRGAAGIVALYPSILDSITERIGEGKNRRLIFNAVDLNRFRPGLDTTEFRAKYAIGSGRVVSFVGTFGTHIDFNTMLDAAAHFAGREDVKFVFIGTGGQREKLQDRLAKGDLDHVQWIGWIDHSEMPLAWATSHLTFWAIHNHALYRSILQSKLFEAFASGTPVAIAVEGITTDIVTGSGGGFTVPFGDSAALAAALNRLLQDDALREHTSQAARAYAEANFDPERVVEGYEEVLKNAIL